MEFKQKNVLITGGTKGIGKATAMAFAERGANVGMVYSSDDAVARNSLSQLKKGNHSLFKFDVSDDDHAEKLTEAYLEKYSTIDILVNNAGVAMDHEIDRVNFEEWKEAWNKIITTNLLAVANLSYLISLNMIQKRNGRIINISSRGAFRGEPSMPAYGASKAGLNALSQSMAKSLGRYNIGVSVVARGFTETNMGVNTLSAAEKESLQAESPFGRMAKPEEVANVILFLASEKSLYLSGAIIDVNGASYLRS